MANNIHLEQSPTIYNRFQPNQVLTDGQLNAMIDYFERQHRLSRSYLIGVGIVCGFDFQLDGSQQIVINSGLGLTTDGDLLHEREAKTFSMVSPFDDKAARYAPFWEDDTQRVPLWELVDGSQDVDRQVFELGTFTSETDLALEDMVLVAYLDAFGKEGNICTPLDCNNQGIEQVAKLRYLLVSVDDMRRIVAEQDSIYRQFGSEQMAYYNLPKMRALRVVINAGNSGSSGKLLQQYAEAIAEHRDDFLKALRQLAENFSVLLDPEGKIDTSAWEDHFANVFPLAVNTRRLRISQQYRYGHYVDLTQAYTELRQALFQVLVTCLPNASSFARHLMLGRLAPTLVNQDFDFRHQFYPSPAETTAQQQLLKVRSLYRRLHLMMAAYRDSDKADQLRITPSIETGKRLGDQTIPFYYLLRDVPELLIHWDIGKYQRGQADENLSYHASDYSQDPSTLSPLRYQHEDLPFYRIEGHLGQTYGDVIDDLEETREKFGLDFDIVALRLGAERTDVDLDEYDVFFQDLQVLMTAWRAEQICLLSNSSYFFSGFSLKEPGKHLKYRYLGPQTLIQPGERSLTPIVTQPIIPQPTILGFGTQPWITGNWTLGTQPPPTITLTATGSRVTNTETRGNSVFTDGGQTGSKGKIIEESLMREEDSIGKQIEEVIIRNKGREGATLRDFLKDRVTDHLKDIEIDLGQFDKDEIDVAVDVPLSLIARLQYLTEQQPDDLTDFTPEKIAEYKKALSSLAGAVRSAKDKLQTVLEKTDRQKRGYERDYLQMLNQLEVNVCSAKKMEHLLEEFTDRKEQLLKLTNFTEYAAQHPSMEHRAGVPKGGTFVLVYKDKASPKPRPTLRPGTLTLRPDLVARPKYELLKNVSTSLNYTTNLNANIASSKLADRTRLIVQKKGLSEQKSSKKTKREELRKAPMDFADFLVDNHQLINVEKTIKDYQLVTGISSKYRDLIKGAVLEGIVTKGKGDAEVNVQQYTVVADFCLPYRHSSKLPPLTIALPRERTNVQLPVGFLCVPEDGNRPARFPIIMTPADGVLRTQPDVAGIISKENDRWFFEPEAITPELFGETMRFTVNDQETSAELRIYREPVPGFTFTIDEAKDNGKVISWTVTFENSTTIRERENLQWRWDFGDGDSSSEQNPTHTFSILAESLKDNPERKVSLTILNGPCTASTTEVLTLELPEIGGETSDCRERGMEIIRTDQERLGELFQDSGSRLNNSRDFRAMSTILRGMYDSLDSEKAQLLLFSGRQNAGWNDQHRELYELFDRLSSGSVNSEAMREMTLLIVKFYLIPLGCQKGLSIDNFDTEVLDNYHRLVRRIRKMQPEWFEGNNERLPGVAFRNFLLEYLETAEFNDFKIRGIIKRIIEDIAGR